MNILSFDIEEPWHIIPANPRYRDACNELELEAFFEWLEDVVDQHEVTPILFWVGSVAERYKRTVRHLADKGFIIASHSYDHEDFAQFSGKALGEQLSKSKKHLEDILGQSVQSFRAPAFSLGNLEEFWTAIEESGFQFDFSICDAPRVTGGNHNSGLTQPAKIPGHTITEFPMSFNRILAMRMYVTGGGYFRMAPSSLIKLLQSRLDYNMFYIHPIDFLTPTFRNTDPRSLQQRIRQQIKWGDARKKLEYCLSNFKWHTGAEIEWARYYE